MPNHSPTPTNDDLNSLESSVDVDRETLTSRIVPSSRRLRAVDVITLADGETTVRSSTRSTSGVDAHPSRRTSRHSSLTPTLAGDPNLTGLVGPSANGGNQVAAGLSGSASTPDALASLSLSGSLDLARNNHSNDQAQTAASSASRGHQRRAASVNEPMPFHRTTFGRNILLSEDGMTASRVDSEYCNAYVFTERPLLPDDEFVIQIEDINNCFNGGLSVGLTTNDPGGLRRSALPDDPHKLLDRPEYWVVHRDIHTRPKIGNELCFHVTKTGK
jgi:hypothetical protein